MVFLFAQPGRAAVCSPAALVGPYAFQLSGSTTISGKPQPTASLGRLVFDGKGNVTGTASAMLAGFLQGNPVTGTYEAKEDCSLSWKLQDDSGGYQNFGGSYSLDAATVQFRQTDPGGASQGVMKKMADNCATPDLRRRYSYSVSGHRTPMTEGEVARNVSASGTLDVEQNGSFAVDSDCSVRFNFTPPGMQPLPMQMRGFLVSGGNEILAFQTTPGAMVVGHFIADGR